MAPEAKPRGKMAPEAKLRVPFATEGVQNPWTPVTAFNNFFCYTFVNCYSSSRSSVVISSNIITRSIHCLISRQTVQIRKNSSLFPRTRGCFVHSARNRPKVGTIKVMYNSVHHFSFYPTPEPCYMRLCVVSRDWFLTSKSSQFVTEV